jgi:hypothetical protein
VGWTSTFWERPWSPHAPRRDSRCSTNRNRRWCSNTASLNNLIPTLLEAVPASEWNPPYVFLLFWKLFSLHNTILSRIQPIMIPEHFSWRSLAMYSSCASRPLANIDRKYPSHFTQAGGKAINRMWCIYWTCPLSKYGSWLMQEAIPGSTPGIRVRFLCFFFFIHFTSWDKSSLQKIEGRIKASLRQDQVKNIGCGVLNTASFYSQCKSSKRQTRVRPPVSQCYFGVFFFSFLDTNPHSKKILRRNKASIGYCVNVYFLAQIISVSPDWREGKQSDVVYWAWPLSIDGSDRMQYWANPGFDSRRPSADSRFFFPLSSAKIYLLCLDEIPPSHGFMDECIILCASVHLCVCALHVEFTLQEQVVLMEH